MKKLLSLLALLLLPVTAVQAQQKTIPEELLRKLEQLQGELSPAHQFMLFEDFASTGIFGANPAAVPVDYSETAAEKQSLEAELNFYLSQLGVGHVSLPPAVEYDQPDLQLLGIWQVHCIKPGQDMKDYAASAGRSLPPFKKASAADMADDLNNLYDLMAVLETVAPRLEGEKYEWMYVKDGFNYRFFVEDNGRGYRISLLGIDRLKAPEDAPAVAQQGSAAEHLQAASGDLPSVYTVWIQKGKEWFVSVRKEGTAVFLQLDSDKDGDMDFGKGSGWCLKPQGSGYAKYPYTNGRWGTAQSVPSARFAAEIGQLQQAYILTPGDNMSKDRVKLFEKAAYFDDLDVSLPQ